MLEVREVVGSFLKRRGCLSRSRLARGCGRNDAPATNRRGRGEGVVWGLRFVGKSWRIPRGFTMVVQ